MRLGENLLFAATQSFEEICLAHSSALYLSSFVRVPALVKGGTWSPINKGHGVGGTGVWVGVGGGGTDVGVGVGVGVGVDGATVAVASIVA